MYKVRLLNLDKQENWQAMFSSKQEAESWREQQLKKPNRAPKEQQPPIEDLSAEYEAVKYKELRVKEYPNWQDILEALVENMEGRPQKLEQIKEQRAAVRNKYPKPGTPKFI